MCGREVWLNDLLWPWGDGWGQALSQHIGGVWYSGCLENPMAKLDHPAWTVFYLEKDAYCAEVDTVTDKIALRN